MVNDTLGQQRAHLLQDFELNRNSFLIARTVQMLDRTIRKVTRNSQPLSNFYLALFILFFNLLPGLTVVWLFREMAPFQIVGVSWILGVTVSTLGALIAYYLGNYVLNYIRDHLFDMQAAGDLEDLHSYMEKLWFPSHPYQRVLVPVVLWGVFASILFSYVAGQFAGFGVVIGTLIFGFNLGIGFDYLIWMIGLPRHFEKYHYTLNNVDPSSSEVVYRIAQMFNKVMYILAIYFTIDTILLVSIGGVNYIAFPVVLAFWATLSIQFANTQSALRQIISTAKWKTLNNIQADIRALQTSGTLTQIETTDAINRLMDLHERVRLTPDSTLNPRTALNFFNQMMLPLLGILMSYIDTILKFLHLR